MVSFLYYDKDCLINVVLIIVLMISPEIPAVVTAESHGRERVSSVLVEGRPRKIEDHSSLASQEERGEYLSTAFFLIRGARIAVPIFSKDIADITAAALFRQHNLPFDENYIDGDSSMPMPSNAHIRALSFSRHFDTAARCTGRFLIS